MLRLLDLFCGAGGASFGYSPRFEITGVDIAPQPDYPYTFIRADAMRILRDINYLRSFDLVHASPPCQGYSRGTRTVFKPQLIHEVRYRLNVARVPFVIENVENAYPHMVGPMLLCGHGLGLHIARHRLFESPLNIPKPAHRPCTYLSSHYAYLKGWDRRIMTVSGHSRGKGTAAIWQELMGIHWTAKIASLREAIPPAYTAYIGEHAARVLGDSGTQGLASPNEQPQSHEPTIIRSLSPRVTE